MTEEEEATYVREVAVQKTAALRMSLDAVERQGMPFLGEDGPVRAERSAGDGADAAATDGPAAPAVPGSIPAGRADLTGAIRATGPDLAERIRQARERTLSDDPTARPRAPNPERMRR
jgi:hypothetical protein